LIFVFTISDYFEKLKQMHGNLKNMLFEVHLKYEFLIIVRKIF